MKWYIVQDDKWGSLQFWTGETSDYNQPVRTRNKDEAKPFDTASEAYAAALTEPKLQEWKVRRL